MMIVMPRDKWTGPLGDTLRAVLSAPVEMINQREPLFDVLSVEPKSYNTVVKNHRNLLIISTGSQYNEPLLAATRDQNSKPQMIVTATAPSDSALIAYIWEHRMRVRDIFEAEEQERALASWKKHHQTALEKEVFRKFGIEMIIPKGYEMRAESEDFMWFSLEYPKASQGFFIYSTPFNSIDDIRPESLLDRRDAFASRIPGPADGSYMITNREIEPSMVNARLHGRLWAEMRGFWDVEGDFMGGPFVSFSTISYQQKRVITIDCYVYSPEKPKRNFLRQLETLLYAVKFPEDAQTSTAAQ